MKKIENIFIEFPNRETYEEYKSEIGDNSLVFIKDIDILVANGTEYLLVSPTGRIKLIDNRGIVITQAPILKGIPNQDDTYEGDEYYESGYRMVGDWDNFLLE